MFIVPFSGLTALHQLVVIINIGNTVIFPPPIPKSRTRV